MRSYKVMMAALMVSAFCIWFLINAGYIRQWNSANKLFTVLLHGEPPLPLQDCIVNIDFNRDIAAELLDVVTDLGGYKINPKIIIKLSSIISQLDSRFKYSSPEFPTNGETHQVISQDADTCGEVWKGGNFGYPNYEKGFYIDPACNDSKKTTSISDLVTIVLVSNGHNLKTVLQGIKDYDEKLPVIVTSTNHSNTVKESQNFKNVRVMKFAPSQFSKPGKVWNGMVRDANTPYILIARDLSHFTRYAFLKRLVYLLPKSSSVGVSAGATRNLTGHWKLGCHQTDIKNYFLRYSEGYSHSMQNCMLCDHISGPFMAKKSVMKAIPFSEIRDPEVLFEDWFLRVKQSNTLVVNCPDVMFFTQGSSNDVSAKSHVRDSWYGLANEFRVTRIFIPPNTQFMFSCIELGFNCSSFEWVTHYMIPTCCLEQISKTYRELEAFASEVGMQYELDSGSMLAAVKLQGHAPWDHDADIRYKYDKKYFDAFKNNKERFSHKNIRFVMRDKCNTFRIYVPDMYFDIYEADSMTNVFLPKDIQNMSTWMNVLGVWVRGSANPGNYARNKYGPNHLKHARSWIFEPVDSFKRYRTAGSWTPCPKVFHGCLNNYKPDGNLHLTPHYFENLGLSWDKI